MGKSIGWTIVSAASLMVATQASAATIISYDDRATFTAAAGGVLITTFDTYLADTPFGDSSVDVGPFSLLTTGPEATTPTYNIIDALPLVAAESNVNGTPDARVFTGAGSNFFVTLDNTTTAFGADFINLNDGFLRTELYIDGQLVPVSPSTLFIPQFLGFRSDTPFTTIEFRGLANDVFGADNFTIGTTAPLGGVPEPSTWAMLLVGFGFIGGAMRSARRRQSLAVSYT